MKLSTEQLKELRVLCNDSTAWASVLDELIAIRELKGDQVTWPDMPFTFDELEHMHGATFANGYVHGWARKCESVTMKGPLYDRPAKAGRVAQ